MNSLRLFEPNIFEPRLFDARFFDPTLSDTFDTMMRRLLTPMRIDFDAGAMDMRLDVTEVDGFYKVRADLPGVKKEDINIRIDGNTVQIDAEAKQEKEVQENEGKVLRSERWHGSISRSFTLSQEVDENRASAKFADGVLTLDLPKKAIAASKRLAIE